MTNHSGKHYSEQFAGRKLKRARKYNKIGAILFEYDVNNPNNKKSIG